MYLCTLHASILNSLSLSIYNGSKLRDINVIAVIVYHLKRASIAHRSTLFMWLDFKYPAYAWPFLSIVNKICYDNGSSMRHIYGTLFDNTGQPIFTIFFSKIEARKQGNSDTE